MAVELVLTSSFSGIWEFPRARISLMSGAKLWVFHLQYPAGFGGGGMYGVTLVYREDRIVSRESFGGYPWGCSPHRVVLGEAGKI